MIGTSLLFSGSIGGLISPFDTITPTAGYSLRPLALSYTGAVVRVRKDVVGNPEKDFTATQLTNGDHEAFMNTFDESVHTLDVYDDFKRGIVPLSRPTQFYNFEDVSLVADCSTGSSGVLEAHDTLGTLVDHNVEVYTDLDFSTIKTGASLLSACNSGSSGTFEAFTELSDLQTRNDGYVSKWYDQFGSNDASQSADASQPKIWDSSTGLVTEGGRPALDFDGSDDALGFDVLGGTTRTVFIVLETVATTTNRERIISELRFDGVSDNAGYTFEVRGDQTNDPLRLTIFDDGANQINKNNPTIGYALLGYKITSSSDVIYKDGSVLVSGNESMGSDYTSGGISSTAFSIDAKIQEIIIYNTDQSANREDIENNINNYYDIYT
jgi:hypothetical protein